MSKLYKRVITVEEKPTIKGVDYITSEGVLYFGDVWAREGDYATVPKWWLKEVTIEELLGEGSKPLDREDILASGWVETTPKHSFFTNLEFKHSDYSLTLWEDGDITITSGEDTFAFKLANKMELQRLMKQIGI